MFDFLCKIPLQTEPVEFWEFFNIRQRTDFEPIPRNSVSQTSVYERDLVLSL